MHCREREAPVQPVDRTRDRVIAVPWCKPVDVAQDRERLTLVDDDWTTPELLNLSANVRFVLWDPKKQTKKEIERKLVVRQVPAAMREGPAPPQSNRLARSPRGKWPSQLSALLLMPCMTTSSGRSAHRSSLFDLI